MDLEQIKQIFPDGFTTTHDNLDTRNVYIKFDSSKFAIPKSSITSREEILLANLFKGSFVKTESHKSYWQKYLWNETLQQPNPGAYRIIQFKLLLKDESISIKEWISTFKNSFANCEDAFFYEQNCGILVEKKSESILTNEEIYAIVETMDTDFYAQTKLFFGNFWSDLNSLPDLFQEEVNLFNSTSVSMKSSSYENLSQSFLKSLISSLSLRENVLLSKINSEINKLEWSNSLIDALWKNQNNISIASQKLFLHRNTMLYRMDKFHEKTGLQLRDNTDLLLCYIISNL